MITSAQCRAGRGLVGLSQAELAAAAGVGLSTVRDLETERRTVAVDSLAAIRAALESAGVVVIDENGGGAGVRLAKRSRRK
jgi:transcriptional regulator with XRE-family HTH domain